MRCPFLLYRKNQLKSWKPSAKTIGSKVSNTFSKHFFIFQLKKYAQLYTVLSWVLRRADAKVERYSKTEVIGDVFRKRDSRELDFHKLVEVYR